MAQLVERRLGKAEVGGSNPLGSLQRRILYVITGFFFFVAIKTTCYAGVFPDRLGGIGSVLEKSLPNVWKRYIM